MATVTHFFAGANSGSGFQSLFPLLAQTRDTYDLMLLKGGPGAGKSTFISLLGKAMEDEGESVEYLHCSGAPDSLDGLTLPGMHCVILDATLPHALEPRYPAAVDRIVDLGRFCDLTAAKAAREEIVTLTNRCRRAYTRGWRYLQAARQVELESVSLGRQFFDAQRAQRRLDGVISRELRRKKEGEGRVDYRFLGTMTCKGAVWRFDSVDALCPNVYEFSDRWELAGPLLDRLCRTAVNRGWNVIACPSPEEPGRLEHLLIPELGLAFITSRPDMSYGRKPYRRMRLDAMARPEEKGWLRLQCRMAASLRETAAEALAEAKSAHDQLESVYHPYVDYDSVQTLAALETGRLLNWRNRH